MLCIFASEYLNGFEYSYLTLIILFNINQLFHTVKWFQIFPNNATIQLNNNLFAHC